MEAAVPSEPADGPVADQPVSDEPAGDASAESDVESQRGAPSPDPGPATGAAEPPASSVGQPAAGDPAPALEPLQDPTAPAARRLPGLTEGLPRWLAVLVSLGGLCALGGFLVAFYVGLGDFVVVLLMSFILAYLLDPLIDRFEEHGWSRTAAIMVSMGTAMALFIVTLLLLIPYVIGEITALSSSIDGYVAGVISGVGEAQAWVEETTGRELDLGWVELVERLPEVVQNVRPQALDPVKAVAGHLVGSTVQLMGVVFRWSLLPIFTFFFLRDFDLMKLRVFELLPHRIRPSALTHYRSIDRKMGLFIRGQLTLCLAMAVLYALGLVLFTGIDMAVLIGVLSGALFIVPYLGTLIGVGLGTLMAVLKFGASFQVVQVWIVFAVVQSLESVLLTPKIVGDSVGLHAVVVMLAILIAGNIFGLMGVLLAIPVAAILQVLGGSAVEAYQASGWFTLGMDGEGDGDGA